MLAITRKERCRSLKRLGASRINHPYGFGAREKIHKKHFRFQVEFDHSYWPTAEGRRRKGQNDPQ